MLQEPYIGKVFLEKSASGKCDGEGCFGKVCWDMGVSGIFDGSLVPSFLVDEF